MPTNFNEFALFGVLYILAYGIGTVVAMFWKWLRILIVFIVACSFIANLDFGIVDMPNFFVLIVPMCLFVYPTLVKTFAASTGSINPFSWLFERINESRYLKLRQAEQEKERETMERMERIVRMQTEEAERQRQYEREKAEREAHEKAEYQQRRQQAKNESSGQRGSQDNSNREQQRARPKDSQNQDPYETLGVSRNMSKAEIRKAYLKLMNQYAPDHVSHLSKEFQEMAHEKCIAFNLAWKQIQKEKK